MPYKIVEVGGKKYVEVGENDQAIFVHPDGTETPFDAEGATARIGALNTENANKRGENAALKEKVKGIEGLDIEKAKEALKTVENLSTGELKTAAQVNEIKEAAKRAAEQQVSDAQKKAAEDLQKANATTVALEAELHREKIGGGLARSKFVADKLSIPADMVENFFGRNFKLEEGRIVGYETPGSDKKLYSKARPGEIADLDEALEQLVNSYPNKDHIMKGAGGGSGGTGGNSSTGGLPKAEFDKLDPVAKMNLSRGIKPGQQSTLGSR